jgi:hypothetical protein
MKQPHIHTPLSVLLQSMREKWAAGDKKGATSLARFVAPYMHPRHDASRRTTDTGKSSLELHRLSDAELETRIRDLRAAQAAGTGASQPANDPNQPG